MLQGRGADRASSRSADDSKHQSSSQPQRQRRPTACVLGSQPDPSVSKPAPCHVCWWGPSACQQTSIRIHSRHRTTLHSVSAGLQILFTGPRLPVRSSIGLRECLPTAHRAMVLARCLAQYEASTSGRAADAGSQQSARRHAQPHSGCIGCSRRQGNMPAPKF